MLAPDSELWLLEHTVEILYGEMPLFDPKTIVERVNMPPPAFPTEEDRQWEVCLNAIRASAIPVRTINSAMHEVAVLAWAFFKNAHSILPEVILHGDSLIAVQVLLAMAMYMRCSTDARTMSRLLSLAVPMAHSIGLHSAESNKGIEPAEAAMRNRVFWIAYILDAETSLLHGVPTCIRCEDIDTELPGADASDVDGLRVFRLRADLATIQSVIRRRLYAARALQQTDGDLIDTVQELNRLLEAWRAKVPADLAPVAERGPDDEPRELPILLLHLSYYSTVSMVSWASRRLCGWGNPARNWLAGSTRQILSTCPLYSNVLRCKGAAESTVRLFIENAGSWQFMEFW